MRTKHTAILMPGTADIQPNKYRSSRAIGRAAANRNQTVPNTSPLLRILGQ
jgi:hypothetical protein